MTSAGLIPRFYLQQPQRRAMLDRPVLTGIGSEYDAGVEFFCEVEERSRRLHPEQSRFVNPQERSRTGAILA